MPEIQSWHCDTAASGTDCYVTGYGNATTSYATSTPLHVQDAGGLVYCFAWLIFMVTIVFLGFIDNRVNPFRV